MLLEQSPRSRHRAKSFPRSALNNAIDMTLSRLPSYGGRKPGGIKSSPQVTCCHVVSLQCQFIGVT